MPAVRCQACERELREDARFCDVCGSAVAAGSETPREGAYTPRHLSEGVLVSRSALEGEHKRVTVLFADVQGSMELAQEVDEEQLHRILDRFFSILAEGVHHYGGTVNQYTGDGIMALFGAPVAHEDHAERACHAALDLLRELREYAQELRLGHGLGFGFRIGLNSGPVVVGKIGDDLRMDYTAQGRTVGLASRMEQLAESGTACMTAETARLVEGYFELRDLGDAQVKGVADPVRVFALEGPGELRTRLERARRRGFSRLVGRRAELASLERALDEAVEGRGRVVAAVGEPGVGKSRLCLEFLARARERGVAVYEAHCPAHGQTLPFLPLIELLRRLFDIGERDGERDARRKIAGELLLLDPELRDSLPLLLDFVGVPDPAQPAPPLDNEAREARLHHLLRQIVRARSAEAPSILYVDDLHWIDAGSDAFLASIIEAAQQTRTLVLVNFRPEYQASWFGSDHFERVALVPLGPEEIDELLRDRLGNDASLADLPAQIRERTAGNPFFVEEVVQSLVDSGRLEGERGSYRLTPGPTALEIPASVEALLAARIDRLSTGEKDVLQAASVIGKTFSEGVLAPIVDATSAELRSRLATLERGGYLALHSEGDREHAFRHPLTQEVAYASQLSESRALRHAAVARALISRDAAGGAEPQGRAPEQASVIAHHFDAAGDLLEALRWHHHAVHRLQSRDFSGALFHARRMLELCESLEETDETLEAALAGRHHVLQIGGRGLISREEAERRLAESRDLFERALGRPRSELPLRAATHFYWVLVGYGLSCIFGGDPREALDTFREAEALVKPSGQLLPLLGSRLFQAQAALQLGDLHSALALFDGVLLELDRDPDARRTLESDALGSAGVRTLRASILTRLGRLDDAVPEVQSAIELAHAHGSLEWLGQAHVGRAMIFLLRGELDATLGEATRAADLSERSGNVGVGIEARGLLGAVALARGDAERALGDLQLAFDGMQRSGVVMVQTPIAGNLALAHAHWGDRERSLGLVKDAVTAAALRGAKIDEAEAQLALGRVVLLLGGDGAKSEAEAALSRAAELVEQTDARVLDPKLAELRAALESAGC